MCRTVLDLILRQSLNVRRLARIAGCLAMPTIVSSPIMPRSAWSSMMRTSVGWPVSCGGTGASGTA